MFFLLNAPKACLFTKLSEMQTVKATKWLSNVTESMFIFFSFLWHQQRLHFCTQKRGKRIQHFFLAGLRRGTTYTIYGWLEEIQSWLLPSTSQLLLVSGNISNTLKQKKVLTSLNNRITGFSSSKFAKGVIHRHGAGWTPSRLYVDSDVRAKWK